MQRRVEGDDPRDGGGTSSGMSEGRTMQEQLSRATLGAKAEMPNREVIACPFLKHSLGHQFCKA